MNRSIVIVVARDTRTAREAIARLGFMPAGEYANPRVRPYVPGSSLDGVPRGCTVLLWADYYIRKDWEEIRVTLSALDSHFFRVTPFTPILS